jgi:hypothetical protein
MIDTPENEPEEPEDDDDAPVELDDEAWFDDRFRAFNWDES